MDDNGSNPNAIIFHIESHAQVGQYISGQCSSQITWSSLLSDTEAAIFLMESATNAKNEEKQRFYGLSKKFETAK